MKILAFAASNSSRSINGRLIAYASQLISDGLIEGAEVETLDLNDFEMPIYSADREMATGIPRLAQEFYDAITSADAVLISFAEHNGSFTAAYKNVFDWTSRINMRVFQDKPTVMLSASPGGRGGATVLQTAVGGAPHFGNDLKASQSIPSFGQNFDTASGSISDPDLDSSFRAAIAALAL